MRELTPNECAFLDEMHDLYFEQDFLSWIEHMEEDYPA